MRRMALALALLLFAPSCEDSDRVTDIPEVDESKSYIGTFAPSSWSVSSGGTVGLNATVVNPVNTPLSGRTVTFDIISGPGSLSADSLTTNEQGAVQLILMTQPGEPGNSTIRARVEDSHKDLTIQVVDPGGPGDEGQPASISLEAEPPSLIGNGRTSSSVTAGVFDGLNNPVGDGTAVKFAAGESFSDVDGDGYFTAGVDSILNDADGDGSWDEIGTIDFVASTVGGAAIATYNAPEDTGTVYIKATAGDVSSDVTIELLPVTAELEVASIVLVAPSPTLQVKGTGGTESTPITAYCYDVLGRPVGANWGINFLVVYGPGGGEGLEGQGYGPMTYYTDEEGKATVSVTSGTVSGTMYVSAQCGEVSSKVTQVGISAGPPAYISLGVNPGNIRGWDIEHVPAEVSALVGDLYHNRVSDDTAVYFTVDEGTIIGDDDSGVSFTQNGFANASFYSGEPREDGIVEITANTMGGNVSAVTHLITSGPPANIYFIKYPQSLIASASSDGDVLVRVTDINDNFVVDGTVVRFDTDYGEVTPTSTTSDGLYDSIAEANMYGEVLDFDDSMPGPTDDGVGAIATLTAGSSLEYGSSSSVSVQLTTTVARSDRSLVTLPQNIPLGATVPLYVTIMDRNGNPLGDHSLSFSVSTGSIDSLAVTDYLGEAVVTFAAPETAAEVLLTVRDLDPVYGGLVMFESIVID